MDCRHNIIVNGKGDGNVFCGEQQCIIVLATVIFVCFPLFHGVDAVGVLAVVLVYSLLLSKDAILPFQLTHKTTLCMVGENPDSISGGNAATSEPTTMEEVKGAKDEGTRNGAA